jgi:hypothetical protein
MGHLWEITAVYNRTDVLSRFLYAHGQHSAERLPPACNRRLLADFGTRFEALKLPVDETADAAGVSGVRMSAQLARENSSEWSGSIDSDSYRKHSGA